MSKGSSRPSLKSVRLEARKEAALSGALNSPESATAKPAPKPAPVKNSNAPEVFRSIILIRKTVTQMGDGERDIYYFDVGVSPDAIRCYVKSEYVRFLMNEGRLRKVNDRVYLARYLPYSQLYRKDTGTIVVGLGDRLLGVIGLQFNATMKEVGNEQKNIPGLRSHYLAPTSEGKTLLIGLFEFEPGKPLDYRGLQLYPIIQQNEQ